MNPFVSGKVVGVDFEPSKYHEMGGKRGREDFVMSRSELMEFDHCPSRWLRGVGDTQTSEMRFGDVVDCLVTAPKTLNDRFAVCPTTYTNEKGEIKPWNFNAGVCKEWRDDQAGKTILKNEEMAEAIGAKQRLEADHFIARVLKGADKQVCVTAIYKGSNGIAVPVKALIDLVPNSKEHRDALADLKTDRNAEPQKWQRTVFERDYHIQAAMYLDIYNSAFTAPFIRNRFLHVIVENVPPFEPARRMLSEAFIEVGRARYLAALERYCDCLQSEIWPGFDDEGRDVANGWRLVEPEAWMIL